MFNLDHFLIYENVTFLDVILTWKWKTDRIVNDKKAIFEIPFDFLLHAINHNIFELTRNSKIKFAMLTLTLPTYLKR